MFFLNPRILILASLTALAPFAIDTYLPAFQVMEYDLATNSNFIQQTLTFYLVPYTIMTIFHGAISDSIGRINTIKYGMFGLSLGERNYNRLNEYCIKHNLYKQTVVDITKFGSFYLNKSKGELSRLPGQEKVYIPPRLIPKFRYSSIYKKQLAGIKLEERESLIEDNELPLEE